MSADILGRLGRMGFINALPVEWGLEKGGLAEKVEIVSGPPTRLNALMEAGQLDVSAVSSVAALKNSADWLALPGPCIAGRGRVGSVFLVSSVPVAELDGRTIAATAASATSVRLLELLLERLWGVTAEIVPQVRPAPARLVIGDEALRRVHPRPPRWYYDLGQAWRELTGLGFVFGLWAIRRDFVKAAPRAARALVRLLEYSAEMGGTAGAPMVSLGAARVGLAEEIISDYYRTLVHRLDEDLKTGLKLFARWSGFDPRDLEYYDPLSSVAGAESGRWRRGDRERRHALR